MSRRDNTEQQPETRQPQPCPKQERMQQLLDVMRGRTKLSAERYMELVAEIRAQS